MIYSKKTESYIPTTVERISYENSICGPVTKYIVKDGKIPVGRVSLTDVADGVYVNFIENFHPDAYKNFGATADQIEVEHCLKRGLDTFEIRSDAALNSHAVHYLRGKRFMPAEMNNVVKNIIDSTPAGEKYNTKFLGTIRMYMPKELITKYINIIKKIPLLR